MEYNLSLQQDIWELLYLLGQILFSAGGQGCTQISSIKNLTPKSLAQGFNLRFFFLGFFFSSISNVSSTLDASTFDLGDNISYQQPDGYKIMPEGLKCNSTSFSHLKVNSNTIWQIVNRNPFNASWRVFSLTSVSSACPLPSFYALPLLPSAGCFATSAEPGGTELDVLLSALQLQRRLRLREWAGQCQQFKEQWKKKNQTTRVYFIYPSLNVFFSSNSLCRPQGPVIRGRAEAVLHIQKLWGCSVRFLWRKPLYVHVNHCSTFCLTKQMMRIIHNQASINGLIYSNMQLLKCYF